METSGEVLLVGGCVSLTYGFLLGIPLSATRMRSPVASRHLVTAHLAAIVQGAILVALSSAMHESDLPSGLETLAASALVAGAVLFVAGAVANWLQAVGDHFAARSLGWKLLAASGPINVIAIVIVLVGIVRGR